MMATKRPTKQLAEAMLAKIDTDIVFMSVESLKKMDDVLTNTLLYIRSMRNLHRPINRLPAEILTMIFREVPAPFFTNEKPEFCIWHPEIRAPRDIIAATHVCRHWRELILGTPSLWTNIVNFHDDLILQRSSAAPLKVYIDNSPGSPTGPLLQTEGPRLQELHWEGLENNPDTFGLNFPAPYLEYLTLAGTRTNLYKSSTPVCVLFNEHTPRLRRLSLTSFKWLPGNQFTQLTHLFLSKIHAPKLLSRILTLLSENPMLEDLVLMDLPNWFMTDENETRIVSLDRLRRCVLGSENMKANSISLLSHVTLNVRTAVRLFKIQRHDWTDQLSHALSRLPVIGSVTKLSITWEWSKTITAVGPFSGVTFEVDETEWIPPISDIFPMTQLRELWIIHTGSGHMPPKDILGPLLKSVSSLELLVVSPNFWSDADFCALRDFGLPGLPHSLSTIHMLLDRDAKPEPIFDNLVEDKGYHCIKHVLFGYLPEYSGQRLVHTRHNEHFESVEGKDFQVRPTMSMPDVCTTEAHVHWPSWTA
ncbi:hypothetical protein AcV7_000233 [Taiwanofungus camphoratus]|nr:hypothetical protein AcV7_000233 [Antrodia cinnamomea]